MHSSKLKTNIMNKGKEQGDFWGREKSSNLTINAIFQRFSNFFVSRHTLMKIKCPRHTHFYLLKVSMHASL